MYKRILVTLDQSELAEQALPHAAAIAQAMDAVVELLFSTGRRRSRPSRST